MKTLFISIRSEIFKTKRTASFYFTIIAAVFGPLMSMLDVVFGEGVPAGDRNIIFSKMMTDKFQMTGLVMFPLFIVLICTLLPQVEFRNNTWKQVLAAPQPKGNIFLAKLFNTHLLIGLFLVANQLAMLITVTVLHFKDPSLQVLNQPISITVILSILANNYIALLAMISIQFLLGLRFKNFIIPIAIGFSCWITGLLMAAEMEVSFARYFPYSFHVNNNVPKVNQQFNFHWLSFLYAVIILVGGFIYFNREGKKI